MAISDPKKNKKNPLNMVTKWQNLGVREGLLLLYGGSYILKHLIGKM
jgi:hypothetical protein